MAIEPVVRGKTITILLCDEQTKIVSSDVTGMDYRKMLINECRAKFEREDGLVPVEVKIPCGSTAPWKALPYGDAIARRLSWL